MYKKVSKIGWSSSSIQAGAFFFRGEGPFHVTNILMQRLIKSDALQHACYSVGMIERGDNEFCGFLGVNTAISCNAGRRRRNEIAIPCRECLAETSQ